MSIKNLIIKKSISILASYTCHQRWSVLAVFFLYLALFGIIKLASIPLRSSEVKIFQATDLASNDGTGRKIFSADERDVTKSQTLLQGIFERADTNNNGLLSPEELATWINNKTSQHINQAMMNNYGLFTQIDTNPRNGVITWDEYHRYFLKQHGVPSDNDENHAKRHPELTRDLREEISRDKAAWSEAARSDHSHLTVDEFLAFKHPESSHATILALVEDLIEKFDRDGDDILTEEEFSSLQNEEVEGVRAVSSVEAERRREFRESIDASKDGKASRHELLMYIDPKNPRHGKEEADTLVLLADSNHDGQLSLAEIFKKTDLFLGSKMVDTARSFHDEF